MEKLKLKVCGMKEMSNIEEIASLGPAYMGFIFYKKSPRYVGDDFNVPFSFPSSIKRIGVFVNSSTEEMLTQTKVHQLDYLQLHGDESVLQVKELKTSNAKIIKVFSIDDAFDFEVTKKYENDVDFFLFDTKGKYYGGNAKTFNWMLLAKYNQRVPFFLSGGLSTENIRSVTDLPQMNLHAFDVNSGVEIAPGLKDKTKVIKLQKLIESISK
jgi:phosphoribosylanthranilate isomerase